MSELVRVAVDAMGGDNAPGEIVRGAVNALIADGRVHVTLVGREDEIGAALKGLEYPRERLAVLNATEVIEMAEPPVHAIRTKEDSSIVRGLRLVRTGECDAFVSAGSTGAVLAGGQMLIGRVKGIERTPLAPVLPTARGPVLLIDCGANMDPRASQLVQFAQMGSIYMESILGIESPRVALYNVGEEEEKGNALTKEVYPLLKACGSINFIGNIESRDIPAGKADVVVCDAFTGNAILKMYEGAASMLLGEIKAVMMSSLKTKIGALLIKSRLKSAMKRFDASAYGGAPLLGLTGLVVKAHGNATHKEICNAVLQCAAFKEQGINDRFREKMKLVDRTRRARQDAAAAPAEEPAASESGATGDRPEGSANTSKENAENE